MKLFIAGHRGLVGRAVFDIFAAESRHEIITAQRSELSLLDQRAVNEFIAQNSPDAIIMCAAKVGGIYANATLPADFIYENMQMQINVIHSAHIHNINKIIFLGSSCIYPKLAPQPITENSLLTKNLEETNEPYAVAKISGIKMCESYNRQHGRDYRTLMPTNLYGPHDNFHETHSHVIPGLINRIFMAQKHQKDTVSIWGTGRVQREFLFVKDFAEACKFVFDLPAETFFGALDHGTSHINVGFGSSVSVAELSRTIADIIEYKGTLVFDDSKLEGTPLKELDCRKMQQLGWTASTNLETGLKKTVDWFRKNHDLMKTDDTAQRLVVA